MDCPICDQEYPHLVYHFRSTLDDPLLLVMKSMAKNNWQQDQGACSRCIDRAQMNLYQSYANWITHYQSLTGFTILPTPVRLGANSAFTGKGVTICFIDSGFYPHPDLTVPENRILTVIDIANPHETKTTFFSPHQHSWQGTMASVVGIGNGHLTNGVYRSMAPNAKAVLLKVSDQKGHISNENLAKAFHWISKNHEKFNIKVVNCSVSGTSADDSYARELIRLCELVYDQGITIVTAVSSDHWRPISPPASAPNTIAVGGLHDRNTLFPTDNVLYHATFGQNEAHQYKPTLIAPAIWIAAPILPGTDQALEAKVLFDLLQTPAFQLKKKLKQQIHLTRFSDELMDLPELTIQKIIRTHLTERKYINPYFKHVEGTSLAAPIVSSLIAQMLEANPRLSSTTIKELLYTTARPLPGVPTGAQGFGVVQPRSALYKAFREHHHEIFSFSPFINYHTQKITFQYHDHEAEKVELIGDFQNWVAGAYMLKPFGAGIWQITISMLSPGVYRYKYLVNGHKWVTDPRNIYHEPNEYHNFNSRFEIEPIFP